MTTVRDRLWLWGHLGGSHNEGWGLSKPSRITPVEAAYYLGIPNLIMVVFGGKPEPPFDQEALAMSPLKRVVWSIVGDSGSTRNDQKSDLDEVVALADTFPNISGAMMDDFFYHTPEALAGTGEVGRYNPGQLAEFQRRLHIAARPLDLWVVLYSLQLEMKFDRHLDHCDVVTFWTWRSPELDNLEKNFARFVERTPGKRRVLGLYMYDYGPKQPMPVDRMEHQCTLALKWLKEGKIEGMIFLSNCVADIGLDAVEWSRDWISRVGDQPVGPSLDL